MYLLGTLYNSNMQYAYGCSLRIRGENKSFRLSNERVEFQGNCLLTDYETLCSIIVLFNA